MKKIIIIDDADVIRSQLQDFFEKQSHYNVVAIGKDGNEAISLYKKYHPDLITLDIEMPNKNGMQALGEILAHDPQARVVMISGSFDKEKIVEAIHLGAKGFIEKPLDFNSAAFVKTVVEEVEAALEDEYK